MHLCVGIYIYIPIGIGKYTNTDTIDISETINPINIPTHF